MSEGRKQRVLALVEQVYEGDLTLEDLRKERTRLHDLGNPSTDMIMWWNIYNDAIRTIDVFRTVISCHQAPKR